MQTTTNFDKSFRVDIIRCSYCNKVGHTAASCRHKERWEKHLERVRTGKVAPGIPFCTFCLRNGHYLSECSSQRKHTARKKINIRDRVVDDERYLYQRHRAITQFGGRWRETEGFRFPEGRGRPANERSHPMRRSMRDDDNHAHEHRERHIASVGSSRRVTCSSSSLEPWDAERRSSRKEDGGKVHNDRHKSKRAYHKDENALDCQSEDKSQFVRGQSEPRKKNGDLQRTAPVMHTTIASSSVPLNVSHNQNQDYPNNHPTEHRPKRQRIHGDISTPAESQPPETSYCERCERHGHTTEDCSWAHDKFFNENDDGKRDGRLRQKCRVKKPPKPTERRKESLFCLVCNTSGHSTGLCHEASWVEGNSRARKKKESSYCLVCDTSGHSTGSCKAASLVVGDPKKKESLYCLVCNASGHSTGSCQEAGPVEISTEGCHEAKGKMKPTKYDTPKHAKSKGIRHQESLCLVCNRKGHPTEDCATIPSTDRGCTGGRVTNEARDLAVATKDKMSLVATRSTLSEETKEVEASPSSSLKAQASHSSPVSVADIQSLRKNPNRRGSNDHGEKPAVIEGSSTLEATNEKCSYVAIADQTHVVANVPDDNDSDSDEEFTIYV